MANKEYWHTSKDYWHTSDENLSVLTAAEEQDLARKAQNGDDEAKAELITHNLRLVMDIASKIHSNGSQEFDDKVQDGALGLMTAVDKFNPDAGFKFSTYATWWIRQAIFRGLANMDRLVRLPVHVIDKAYAIDKFKRIFVEQYDRDPTYEEVRAAFADLTDETFKAAFNAGQDPISLDQPASPNEEDHDATICDLLAFYNAAILDNDTLSDVEVATELKDLQEKVEKAVDLYLEDREKLVIIYRFGLRNHPQCTLEQVGQMLHITRERVRQIESKALRKLRLKGYVMLNGLDGYNYEKLNSKNVCVGGGGRLNPYRKRRANIYNENVG